MDKDKSTERRKNFRLINRYENDDGNFELGVHDQIHSNDNDGKSWSNPGLAGELTDEEVHDYIGYGPAGYKKTDERIYEEVCDLLMKHPLIDASNIAVHVQEGVVHLTGKVDSRKIKKLAETCADHVIGIEDVRNELVIFKGDEMKRGPEAVTKKDLGIT